MSSVQLSCSTWLPVPGVSNQVDTFGARRAAIRRNRQVGNWGTIGPNAQDGEPPRSMSRPAVRAQRIGPESLTAWPIRSDRCAGGPYDTAMCESQGAQVART